MSYCLTPLPRQVREAVHGLLEGLERIAYVRRHGGTPSARCLKDIEVVCDCYGIAVVAKSSEVHVKRAFFGAKNPCRNCAGIMEMDSDCGGDCDVCQIRWTWQRRPNNTVYFSRLGRRSRYWD